MSKKYSQLKKIITAGLCMLLGSFVFKWLPMQIWGASILFDASFHIITASFILYCIWFFVDQEKDLRIPFAFICAVVLFVISTQRILVNAHNDVGLLMGAIVSIVSIAIAEKKNLKGKLKF